MNHNLEMIYGNEAKPEIEQEIRSCKTCEYDVDRLKCLSCCQLSEWDGKELHCVDCTSFSSGERCNECDDHNLFQAKGGETTKTQCKEEKEVSTIISQGGGSLDGLTPPKLAPIQQKGGDVYVCADENSEHNNDELTCGTRSTGEGEKSPSFSHNITCPNCQRLQKENDKLAEILERALEVIEMKEIDLQIRIGYEIGYTGARQYKTPYPIIRSIAGVEVPSDMWEMSSEFMAIYLKLLEQLRDEEQVNEDMEFAKEMIREERG